MDDFRGTALITGASSGIGAVYADRLARRGYDLVLVARRLDRLDELAERLRSDHGRGITTVAADLASPEDLTAVERLVTGTPHLTMLVNCAGSGALGPAAAVDPAKVEGMLSVNVTALTRLSLAGARQFISANRGTIINVASVLAVMTPATAASYAGSKAYVLAFSRSLNEELASRGIAVQVVLPGPVRSEFFGDAPIPFPDTLVMSPEVLVDAALAGLDQGETVTFPNLPDEAAWQRFEDARGALAKAVSQTGAAAGRYSALPASPVAHV